MPGFGPGTFGYGKVSQVHGEVSLFKWTLESVSGFEPGTLIWMRRIGTCVGTKGVLHRPNRHVTQQYPRTWYSRHRNRYVGMTECG